MTTIEQEAVNKALRHYESLAEELEIRTGKKVEMTVAYAAIPDEFEVVVRMGRNRRRIASGYEADFLESVKCVSRELEARLNGKVE